MATDQGNIDAGYYLEEATAANEGKFPGDPVSLRQLIGMLGGLEGDIRSRGSGKMHHVSLSQWAGRDPDRTLLYFGFCAIDPRLVGTKRRGGSRR